MMFEIKQVQLKELLSEPTRNGLTKPKAIRGQGVPMIAMGEVFANNRIYSIQMERVPVTDKELLTSSIYDNDLLFARQSLVLEGAGKCCIVKEVNEPTVFESHLIRVRVDKTKALPDYIYYYFNSYQGRENIKTIVEQVAAAGIRGSDLVNLYIPIPLVTVQQQIVQVLMNIDDKIAVNTAINENLEQQIQAILLNMIQQDSKKDSIETVKLGEYLYIKGRIGWKGLKKDEYLDSSDYRIINGESLTKDGIDWNKAGFISKERYDESPEIMLQVGDILLSKDGTIGKIGYVDNLDSPSTVASGIFVIRNIKPNIISTQFIYYLLKSKLFSAFIASRTEGSVIPHLYQKDFMEFAFPLPNADEMSQFDALTSPLFATIIKNLRENEFLTATRDALLPKLMSGEIDVSAVKI